MAKKSKQLIESILTELIKAKTIKTVLKEHDLSFQAWNTWLIKDPELMNRYHQTKLSALDLELSDLEDELSRAIAESREKGKKDMSFINAIKLKMTHIHWKLSRLDPKKYSNNSNIVHKGDVAEPLIVKFLD